MSHKMRPAVAAAPEVFSINLSLPPLAMEAAAKSWTISPTLASVRRALVAIACCLDVERRLELI
jgi:hypothetical protein